MGALMRTIVGLVVLVLAVPCAAAANAFEGGGRAPRTVGLVGAARSSRAASPLLAPVVSAGDVGLDLHRILGDAVEVSIEGTDGCPTFSRRTVRLSVPSLVTTIGWDQLGRPGDICSPSTFKVRARTISATHGTSDWSPWLKVAI